MVLKKGSKGDAVKMLQEYLDTTADGDFGSGTEALVKAWQSANGCSADGIVGPNTWDAMGLATTDNSEAFYETSNFLQIERYMLPSGEYKSGPTSKEYLFLHHTAGWHNPYNCIDQWGRDDRGSVATEFVMGGQSVKGNDDKHDGTVLQCIPEGGYGWHLGKNGSQSMHTNSVGIEVCNFGYVVDGKTYAGTNVYESQIVTLDKAFRGHKTWHRYSDMQIENLGKFILHIAERDNINVREGLPNLIRKNGVKAFDFNEDAYYGKIKGLLTHTNTRRDKTDMFPQQELIDMLLSI
jgi:hypothetical protein